MKRALLLVLMVMSFHLQAADTGNDLLEECNKAINWKANSASADLMQAAKCLAFLDGLASMQDILVQVREAEPLFFRPDGATRGQASRVVKKYLDDNPQELHEDKAVLAVMALMGAFPCE